MSSNASVIPLSTSKLVWSSLNIVMGNWRRGGCRGILSVARVSDNFWTNSYLSCKQYTAVFVKN